MNKIFFPLLFLFITASCATKNNKTHKIEQIFETSEFVFQSTDSLSINEAINYQKQLGASDKTDNKIMLFLNDEYYPNNKGYSLTSYPKKFERVIQKNYSFKTHYFHSVKDSLVKVIFYEWGIYHDGLFYDESDKMKEENIAYFRNKFNQLKRYLSEILGEPDSVQFNSLNKEKVAFNDYYKWFTNNKSKARLALLGNHRNGFWQIRLTVYYD